jgi:protoporphyrinogen oxidase
LPTPNNTNPTVAVLGAGLAGLAAAQRLRNSEIPIQVYEKNGYVGGHAATHHLGDFVFDDGPHISFTKRPEIQKLFSEAVDGEYLEYDTRMLNYWRGHWVNHPAQCFLHGLPVDTVERCIVDFVKAQYEDEREIKNYEDWCIKSLGQTFSEEFTFSYTRKYWTTEAKNLTTDWVGPRMYPPKLEEVIAGALSPQDTMYHYLSTFRYPTHGGFGAYLKAVDDHEPVNLKHDVDSLDLKRRRLGFADGSEAFYDKLVTSMPLPELIKRIKDVPKRVLEASQNLHCTELVLVSVGVQRDEGWPDVHWMYFYDEDIIFSRAHLPAKLSPNNVPPGCGSVQVEVYHSPTRPLPTDDVLNRAMTISTRRVFWKRVTTYWSATSRKFSTQT